LTKTEQLHQCTLKRVTTNQLALGELLRGAMIATLRRYDS